MHYFSNLFDKVLYIFRTSTLSIIGSTPTELAWQLPIACIQCWDTPDDGQCTCPKHVEYFIKQIWEIVHLVGFHYKNTWIHNFFFCEKQLDKQFLLFSFWRLLNVKEQETGVQGGTYFVTGREKENLLLFGSQAVPTRPSGKGRLETR